MVGSEAMFLSITLIKLETAAATDAVRDVSADALRAACTAQGYDAFVGVPADAASTKSWDLALTVSFRTREQATSFDASALVAANAALDASAIAVTKGWTFESGT